MTSKFGVPNLESKTARGDNGCHCERGAAISAIKVQMTKSKCQTNSKTQNPNDESSPNGKIQKANKTQVTNRISMTNYLQSPNRKSIGARRRWTPPLHLPTIVGAGLVPAHIASVIAGRAWQSHFRDTCSAAL